MVFNLPKSSEGTSFLRWDDDDGWELSIDYCSGGIYCSSYFKRCWIGIGWVLITVFSWDKADEVEDGITCCYLICGYDGGIFPVGNCNFYLSGIYF